MTTEFFRNADTENVYQKISRDTIEYSCFPESPITNFELTAAFYYIEAALVFRVQNV